jgi:hypothetical protein
MDGSGTLNSLDDARRIRGLVDKAVDLEVGFVRFVPRE